MGIQDSLGLWIVRRKFRIPGTGHRILYPWNLDSGFQSWVGFRIPWAVFRIPKPRISFSTGKNFPASGILILLHGAVSCLIVCSVSGLNLIPWNTHRSLMAWWCCRPYLTHVGQVSQRLGGDGCNKSQRFFKSPLIFYREVKTPTRENVKSRKATHKNPKVKLFFQKWDVGLQWSAKKKKLQSSKLSESEHFALVFVLLCSFENLKLFCFFVFFLGVCVCFFVVDVVLTVILDLLVQVT